MDLHLTELGGSAAFAIRERAPQLQRVYGAVFNPDQNTWYFPAYPPFGLLVLEDLKKVAPDCRYAPEVPPHIEYLRSVPDRVKKLEVPISHFHTAPFDHQREGLTFAFHHPRSFILWEPGTGKSKVIVDLRRALAGRRFLVLTPKVTVLNWLEQVQMHAPGELSAAALVGTPERKRKTIREHKKYDVIVASYGTARTMGLPKVLPPAMRLLKQAQDLRLISDSMLQALGVQIRRLSDPDRQVDFVWAKLFGASLPEIKRFIEEHDLKENPYQWLEDMEFDAIVGDESHCISDMRSMQSKVAVTLSRRAGRRHLMSGTPTAGNPLHLYPQLKFLAPCLVPEDWLRYSDKFLVRAKHNKRIVLGFQNLNILNARVQRVATHKTKAECLDLPPRLPPIDIVVDLSAEQKRLYNTLVSNMEADLGAFFENTSGQLDIQNSAILLNKLAQVSSGFVFNTGKKDEICDGCEHLAACVAQNVLPFTQACKKEQAPREQVKYTKENPKLDALEELLDTLLVEGTDIDGKKVSRKVIVWAVYMPEMDAIQAALEKRKIGFVRVDGRTGAKIQERINQFNKGPDTRVYLGQVQTGVGITLNAATYMIYYSLPWALRDYEQSIDRNYRVGQTEKVTVYRLLGRGTVDEYKVKALDQKKDLSTVLTSNLACVACSHAMECLEKKVELFDPGCKYQRSARRAVARAEAI